MKIRYIGAVLCLTVLLNGGVAAASLPITAKSAVVIEASTGQIIYAKDAETRRYPASTTKMMTLIVALESGKLDDTVVTSAEASATEGSSLWLEQGEKVNFTDLLYGIMLVSGNDATVAIAEHVAGSVKEYARLMTAKARAIGALNTNFTNSSGLPDPNHYSTALDLARIAAYGYQNPQFADIVGAKNKLIPWNGRDYQRDLWNENRMLWLYDGANGVKTGYTEAAGPCLVSAAKRDGVQLIAVVLDSDEMWSDSMRLLDYGFANIEPVTYYKAGDVIKTVAVKDGKTDHVELILPNDIVIPLLSGNNSAVVTVVDTPSSLTAGVEAGRHYGKLKLLYEDKIVCQSDLIAASSVERRSFFAMIYQCVLGAVKYMLAGSSA